MCIRDRYMSAGGRTYYNTPGDNAIKGITNASIGQLWTFTQKRVCFPDCTQYASLIWIILNRLCSILDCKIEDIMEFVPDEDIK